jgi:ribosomal-protein-alanine N-acetyltransferase
MTSDDLADVVALEMAEQPRPWSERMFAHELETENRTYLVAEAERIVGFGGLMIIGDEAHVTTLLVTESHRGEGVGRRLVRTLIESAVRLGARHLTLEVRTSNETARHLYSGVGLAPVGIRPKYYGDEDALIMWAQDIDQPGFLERLA